MPLSIEVKKALKLLIGTLLLLLVSISGYFFLKMSGVAEKGSAFRENQLRQKELESQNRQLRQQVLEAQAMNNLGLGDMQQPNGTIFVGPERPISSRR